MFFNFLNFVFTAATADLEDALTEPTTGALPDGTHRVSLSFKDYFDLLTRTGSGQLNAVIRSMQLLPNKRSTVGIAEEDQQIGRIHLVRFGSI